MYAQVLTGVAQEFAASPMRFVAEVVQFLVLVGIGWAVAFGFGKRRGMVTNMMAEHAASVKEQLEWAARADSTLVTVKRDAELRVTQAKAEADRLTAEAHAECDAEEQATRRQTDEEAKRIVELSHEALVNERAEMQAELRHELVDLVSEATRTIMNEAHTVAEQRERIEKAIEISMAGRSKDRGGRGASIEGRRPAPRQA